MQIKSIRLPESQGLAWLSGTGVLTGCQRTRNDTIAHATIFRVTNALWYGSFKPEWNGRESPGPITTDKTRTR